MNEETKDCAQLPVVAWSGEDYRTLVFEGDRDPQQLVGMTPLCRLTDAQARLAEKDARIASLEHGNETLRLMRDELKPQVIDYRRRYSECIVRTDNSETLANALKEIELLREANLRLDEEWQAMRHDLSVAQEQLEQLQSAPAERGVVLLSDDELWEIRNQVATQVVERHDDSKTICVKHGRALEAAILARLNPAPATADSDVPGIPVEHEDEATVNEFGGIVESCHFCGAPTRYWHTGTNNPVCPDCAKKHRVEELPNWLADSDVREVK